jgi:dihydroorotase
MKRTRGGKREAARAGERIRIRNGSFLPPGGKRERKADIFIADGRIAAIGRAPRGFRPEREIDAAGRLVLPGLIDLAARFREPGAEHKATIASESLAAVAGGVTTVCCPPDTQPVIDTPAVVELIHRRAAAAGRVRVHAIGALTHGLQGERLAEMHALRSAGCVGVGNALRPQSDSEVLRRAMEYAAGCGLTVFLHAEDQYLRNSGVAHESAVSTRLGLPPIPAAAETVALSRALLLMELTGARVHFCRITTARGVRLIAEAKAAGLPVSADAGICHLLLDEQAIDGYDANCRLDPPLRSAADREALCRGVANGTIDAICSDHQPHDADAKAAPFGLTEPGASTIELLLPLLLELVNSAGVPLARAVDAVTRRPAAILGLDCGVLETGAPADLAIVDRRAARVVEAESMLSAGKNTPFGGRRLRGRVTHTLLAGAVVHEG